jgi:ubiquinone/menaquinone biosynthesis C-methylase UbiE
MPDKDDLAKEWDDATTSWVDFVREGKDYFRNEMNGPAAFRIIGKVKNKDVLDLSCGEGYNTRMLARKGARVVGVDFSREMIRRARQSEERDKSGIKYYISDAADLKELKNKSFDVVTCIMALMDIERYENAISEVARVLKKNGRFIFSITHPCFEYGDTIEGVQIAKWKDEETTENSAEKKTGHLEINRYFGIAKLEVPWNMKRLVKPFRTTSFHRTLTDYFEALRRNGFVVARLFEPKPTARGVAKYSALRKHLRIPHSIIIEAVEK